MRQPTERAIDKNAILEKCYNCFVTNGLDGTSTRLLCEATELTNSSLYYWFDNKEEIVADSTRYGLNKLADDLFKKLFTGLDDLEKSFEEFPEYAYQYRAQIAFFYQVAASPKYGDMMRDLIAFYPRTLDDYSRKLAEKIGCGFEEVQQIVYQFSATVMNYNIWGKNAVTDSLFSFMYKKLRELFNKDIIK